MQAIQSEMIHIAKLKEITLKNLDEVHMQVIGTMT